MGQCHYISKSLFGLERLRPKMVRRAKRSVKPEPMAAAVHALIESYDDTDGREENIAPVPLWHSGDVADGGRLECRFKQALAIVRRGQDHLFNATSLKASTSGLSSLPFMPRRIS